MRTYGAKIDCKDLRVVLIDEKGTKVRFYRQRKEKQCPLISTMKAIRLLCLGCIGYWCYAINTQEEEERGEKSRRYSYSL